MAPSTVFPTSTATLSLVIFTLLHSATAQTCDQCFFTADDADDCRVYGKIEGELVSWLLAPQDCLDSYNIKVTGVDPFSAGCDPPSVNTFVNSGIRGGVIPNSVLGGLGVSEGGFFDQQDDGSNTLKDTITINGESLDCGSDANACYTAMREYFADGAAGAEERNDVCTQVLNRVANDKELEQSDVRNRICQDIKEATTPSTSCGALVSEVQSAIDETPDKICAGYAFGPGVTVAPGCEGVAPDRGELSSSSSSSSTSSSSTMAPTEAGDRDLPSATRPLTLALSGIAVALVLVTSFLN